MTQARPVASLPIELAPPDISPWRQGNRGVEFVHVLDSGRPGPNVMVQALTHGNELCGALALVHLFEQGVAPVRGTLTLVFANVEAYARFDPADPHPSRFADEDLNRVWADAVLFGSRDSSELRRARALQPFVDAADLLLDMHSMSEPCRPLMVCGRVDKNARYAVELGVPADLLLDTGQAAGLRMIERGGFGDPAGPKRALLIECGQHWERAAPKVARQASLRFLRHFGMADSAFLDAHLDAPPLPKQRAIEITHVVTIATDAFRFARPVEGLDVISKADTLLAKDGDGEVRTPYENSVLVMPARRPKKGETAVRIGRYVN